MPNLKIGRWIPSRYSSILPPINSMQIKNILSQVCCSVTSSHDASLNLIYHPRFTILDATIRTSLFCRKTDNRAVKGCEGGDCLWGLWIRYCLFYLIIFKRLLTQGICGEWSLTRKFSSINYHQIFYHIATYKPNADEEKSHYNSGPVRIYHEWTCFAMLGPHLLKHYGHFFIVQETWQWSC